MVRSLQSNPPLYSSLHSLLELLGQVKEPAFCQLEPKLN